MRVNQLMRSEPEQQQGGIPISESVLLKGRCLKRHHPADTTPNPQLYSLEVTSDLPRDSLRRCEERRCGSDGFCHDITGGSSQCHWDVVSGCRGVADTLKCVHGSFVSCMYSDKLPLVMLRCIVGNVGTRRMKSLILMKNRAQQ